MVVRRLVAQPDRDPVCDTTQCLPVSYLIVMEEFQLTSWIANMPAPETMHQLSIPGPNQLNIQYIPSTKLIHSFPAYLMINHIPNNATLPKTGMINVSPQVRTSSIEFSSSYASSSSGSGIACLAFNRAARSRLVDSGVYSLATSFKPGSLPLMT